MRRPPVTHYWTPPARWRSSIFAYLVRDTVGCELQGPELDNRFPASAFISLNWFLQGSAEWSGAAGRRLPAQLLIGKSGPVVTRSVGDIRYFGVSLYPDAFTAAFGVRAAALDGKMIDPREVLAPSGIALFEAVANAPSDAQRCALVEDFLAEHSGDFRVSLWASAMRAGTRLTVELVARAMARSPRQAMRNTRRDLGVGVPELRRFARGHALTDSLAERRDRDKPVSLSDLAATAGYADQSHLTRDVRGTIGRSPAAFLREFEVDEADWIYRAMLKKRERPEA